MRHQLILAGLLVLSACGGESSSNASSSSSLPQAVTSCVDTPEQPALGTVALTTKNRIRLWNQAGPEGWIELPQLGDDPNNKPTQGDPSFVETAAVVPQTCRVFVGACCEPAGGITYWDKDGDDSWEHLFGHLPSISPDGNLLALVAYEELVVVSTQDPETVISTIKLNSADKETVFDSYWLDGDRVVLLAAAKEGVYLRVISVKEGTLSPGVLVTNEVTISKGEVSRVALIGIEEKNKRFAIRIPSPTGMTLQSRNSDTFEIESSMDSVDTLLPMGGRGGRAVSLTPSTGEIGIWRSGRPGGASLGKGYVWVN